jgi:hypothetical protein
MDKMYVVVRRDLNQGLQIAQAVHAGVTFALTYEERENVIVKHAPNESAVSELVLRARQLGYPALTFSEPDLGGQVTAAALGGEAKKLVSNLPLAFRPEDGEHAMRVG